MPTWVPQTHPFHGVARKVEKKREKAFMSGICPAQKRKMREREWSMWKQLKLRKKRQKEIKIWNGWWYNHLSFVLVKDFKMRNKGLGMLIYALSYPLPVLFLGAMFIACAISILFFFFIFFCTSSKTHDRNLCPNGQWYCCFCLWSGPPKNNHPCYEERFTTFDFLNKRKCKWGKSHGWHE